ncbi:MAG: hypothetical protein KZY55_04880 [Paeniclostridium sp.]|uniref:hypothetical protein n=1 Tax=Paraclostridium sordellii TaxID=1505 RepID=UPI0005DF9068|nr:MULTISPECIES: hypothetical protein [Paeniclostridium]MBW4862078.1 hypothetical protein [Paeniclostridium sp.]MBW4873377.1 hypothetical protein [Paeniclostridium sp.]CEN93655.1 lipoprotein [[Clostridium] sordellii] [Paeniclostridium sordellii]CEN94615.1 lipoprotein [[Clostridium] sordellii] [Paeniclostridium sordellii]
MANRIRNISILSLILTIAVSMLLGCTSNENRATIKASENIAIDKFNININEKNAKVLDIGKPQSVDEDNNPSTIVDTKTKVTNISDFDIRNIQLTFREYDKDKNALAKTEALSKITLSPGESVYLQSAHKKYAKTSEVISYSYNVSNKLVSVDLLDDKVNIINTKEKIVKNKNYDILAISEPKILNQVDGGYNSEITIKNLSDKDIGSVVLELAELNGNKEYTNISYVDSYEVIKKNQEVKLYSVHPSDVKKLEVVGYIYDDVKNNTTVEVNLKLNEAILIK